ncbi:hypothetical protein AAC387_Pa03g2027 [Persea americana]
MLKYSTRNQFKVHILSLLQGLCWRDRWDTCSCYCSASDPRISQDAIYRRPHNRLKGPIGKYYLVDAGSANAHDDETLATPYASNLDKEFAANLRDNIAQQMWDER